MILETERLILRGWREDDAPSLFKYASDPHVGPAAGWLPHKDENYSKAVIRTVFSGRETYAITLKGDDEPIGSIGLTLKGSPERPLLEKEAELGYWVAFLFWGRGIAFEASKEIIRHGFDDLELNKLYCAYFEGNERSKRVQEKIGFVFHHTNLSTDVPMLGEIRTEHVNYMTKQRFLELREKDLK